MHAILIGIFFRNYLKKSLENGAGRTPHTPKFIVLRISVFSYNDY